MVATEHLADRLLHREPGPRSGHGAPAPTAGSRLDQRRWTVILHMCSGGIAERTDGRRSTDVGLVGNTRCRPVRARSVRC